METVKIELEAAKETYELGKGLGNILDAVKHALEDGWQPGSDLPEIFAALVAELGTAVQGFEQIKDEVKDPQLFGNAVYSGLSPAIYNLVK